MSVNFVGPTVSCFNSWLIQVDEDLCGEDTLANVEKESFLLNVTWASSLSQEDENASVSLHSLFLPCLKFFFLCYTISL